MLELLSIRSTASRLAGRFIAVAGAAAAAAAAATALCAVPALAVTTITVSSSGCSNGGTLTYDAPSRTVYCSGATTQPAAVMGVATPDCLAGTAPAWNATQSIMSCQVSAGTSPGASLRLGVSLPDCVPTLVTWSAATKTLTCARPNQWLNVDGSTSAVYDSLTDGLIVMRYLFGIRGAALTANALSPTATRTNPATVAAYLDSIRSTLDIDNNGNVDALTDGTLILRYLFGSRGTALVNGAVGNGAFNATSAGIEAKIQSLMP